MDFKEPTIDCWQYVFDKPRDYVVAVGIEEVEVDGWRYADVYDIEQMPESFSWNERTLEWVLTRYRLVRYNGKFVQVAGCRGMMCSAVTDAPEGRLCPDGMQIVYRLIHIEPDGFNCQYQRKGNKSGEVITGSIEELMSIVQMIARASERDAVEGEMRLDRQVITDPKYVIEAMLLSKLALQTEYVCFDDMVYRLPDLFELNPLLRDNATDPEEITLRNMKERG